jgi:hypothetical protein
MADQPFFEQPAERGLTARKELLRLAASRLDEGKDRHPGIVREYSGAHVGSSEAAGRLPMISIPVRLFRRADRQPYNEFLMVPVLCVPKISSTDLVLAQDQPQTA